MPAPASAVPAGTPGKAPSRGSACGSGFFGRLTRFAWVAIPLIVLGILGLAALDPPGAYDPPLLVYPLNFIFLSATSLVVAYLAGAGYLFGGASALLFQGLGVFAFGLGSHFSSVLLSLQEHNVAVTVYDSSALLSAGLNLIGALGGSAFLSQSEPDRKKFGLVLAHLAIVGTVLGLTAAAWQGLTPPFFIQGQGATPLRNQVLLITIALFAISAALFEGMYEKFGHPLLRWYGVGLGLLAAGLLASLIVTQLGSPMSWLGRFAHYLAGVYMLAALLSIVSPHGVPLSRGLATLFTEARAEYQTLVETAHDAIVLLDSSGQVRYWNDAAQSRFGFSLSDVFGRDFIDLLVPPEGREMVRTRLGLEPRTGQVEGGSLEAQVTHRSGQAFWAEISLYPRRTLGGMAAVAIVRDVTGRKRTEEALRRANEELEARVRERTAELAAVNAKLREDLRRRDQLESALRLSEEKFFKAFGANPAGLILAKLTNDRLVDANDGFLRLFGFTRKEALGQTTDELRIWRTPRDRNQLLLDLLTTGSVRNREVALANRSGETFIGLVSCELIPVREESMVLFAFLDITERKELEHALAAQKALLETILEQMADPIVACDQTGRFLFVNRAAQRRLEEPGLRPGSLDGLRGWPQLYSVDGQPLPPEQYPLRRALQGESVIEQEVLIIRTNGTRHHLLVSAGPLRNDRQELAAAVATFTEITRLKRAEADLKVALEDKDVLLREIRHRFRNNLQILSALFAMQSDAVHSEEARVALEESRQRVFSMARLQEQLYRSAERVTVRMDEYLQSLVRALEDSYTRAGIRVTVAETDVVLDPDRANPVGLIVTELVTNAFKYAFPDGRRGEIGVEIARAGDRYVVRVRDTGVGLPRDFNIEQASSLGLQLVRILAERLKGALSVDGSAGTTLTIAFPVLGPNRQEAGVGGAQDAPARNAG